MGVVTKLWEYGQEEMETLQQADGVLGAAIRRLGKVERTVIPDLFAALVHAIVGQLISVKAAHAIWERMQYRLGEIVPTHVAAYSTDELRACGLSSKKADYILKIARIVADGEFDLEALRSMPDRDVVAKLTTLHGVGTWTAEMLLISSLERRDVVSWGDIAIRRGMMKLYGLRSLSRTQFDRYCRRYSPLGSIASIYLWKMASES